MLGLVATSAVFTSLPNLLLRSIHPLPYGQSEHQMPDKPTYEDLEKERDDLRAKLEAQTQSYREARSMWPEGDTYEATAKAIRHEWDRATTYRNRALYLRCKLRRDTDLAFAAGRDSVIDYLKAEDFNISRKDYAAMKALKR